MTELTLPSIDGKPLVKPKAKSTDRHKRETAYKIAKDLNLSVATLRRGTYVLKFGSKEIIELLRSGQISVWRGYNYVRRQQEKKLFELLLKAKEKGEL